MSPEYALDGMFSVKSDVYSFGVIVIEIVSGMKMRGFYQSDPSLNLLGYVSFYKILPRPCELYILENSDRNTARILILQFYNYIL